jgi:hypothetical protein
MAAAFGIFILLLFVGNIVAQFVVGAKLNSTRKQSSLWWLWVLFLGWIGVIVIACQKPTTTQNQLSGQNVVYVQVAPDGKMVPLNVEVVPAAKADNVY